MSDLAWRADGIERAEAAGGLTLERYRKPGFTGGQVGLRVAGTVHAQGFETYSDPEPWEYDEEERAKAHRRRSQR